MPLLWGGDTLPAALTAAAPVVDVVVAADVVYEPEYFSALVSTLRLLAVCKHTKVTCTACLSWWYCTRRDHSDSRAARCRMLRHTEGSDLLVCANRCCCRTAPATPTASASLTPWTSTSRRRR